MATRKKPPSGARGSGRGRVTPPGGDAGRPPAATGRGAPAPAPRGRGPRAAGPGPSAAGPSGAGARPGRRRGFDPATPYQVGRRPSNPLLLLAVGVLWVAAGVIALFGLHAGWRFVPAVVGVGIGLYFVRGASATLLRRERRQGGG